MSINQTEPKVWLIVGASRGIGFEYVRQLLLRGDRVLATFRDSASERRLKELPRAHEGLQGVFSCDMLNEKSIDDLVARLQSNGHGHIDHVVLNAGVLKYPNRATELSYSDFAFHLHTNTIGPIICSQRLLKSGISIGSITFMSSDSGSTQRFLQMEDGFAAYSASKAALNQSLRHLDAELKRKGREVVILALHPGEVKTDMAMIDLGWEVEGQMTPEQSVSCCLEVIESKRYTDSGTFWTWENKPYPW